MSMLNGGGNILQKGWTIGVESEL